jgi:hypothetical protein
VISRATSADSIGDIDFHPTTEAATTASGTRDLSTWSMVNAFVFEEFLVISEFCKNILTSTPSSPHNTQPQNSKNVYRSSIPKQPPFGELNLILHFSQCGIFWCYCSNFLAFLFCFFMLQGEYYFWTFRQLHVKSHLF